MPMRDALSLSSATRYPGDAAFPIDGGWLSSDRVGGPDSLPRR